MNALDRISLSSGLAKCREAIQAKPYDAWARRWNDGRTSERVMWLTLASLPNQLATRTWEQLDPDYRGLIRKRAADMREWLNRVFSAEAA